MARKKVDVHTRLLNKLYKNPLTKCWEWKGVKNNVGYGMIRVSTERGMASVHRVAYEVLVDKIPEGMLVLHKCNNYICCNPDHLELGTKYDVQCKVINKNMGKYFGQNTDSWYATCTHCDYKSTPAVIARLHNDKCKHQPSINNTITLAPNNIGKNT